MSFIICLIKIEMGIGRIEIRPGYSISRVVKGGWHLAGGHGAIHAPQAVSDMKLFLEAGITTFDCADIYTGVEDLIGQFLKKYRNEINHGLLPSPEIHTKYVPDYDQLATLKAEDTAKIIDRSLRRLGVEQLDLVQFAWWDFEIPGHVDAAVQLQRLQQMGKIRHLAVTNYDTKHLAELVEANLTIVANQIQYSVLDRRPESSLVNYCQRQDIHLLCYGVLAGGFLTDKYLDAAEPGEPFDNRSLTKYHLIIEEFGGYRSWQKALQIMKQIGIKYQVGIAEIAIRYVLQKKGVAAVIIGARNAAHLSKFSRVFSFDLTENEMHSIDQLASEAPGPLGPVYGLERNKEGKHGRIMKYNLNTISST